MPFPKRLLTQDEQILLDLRPHWKALAAPVLFTLVVAAATGYGYVSINGPSRGTWRLVIVVAAAVVWIAVAGLRIARWRFTEFVLTNERIVARSGVIAKRAKEIPLERVTDVTVNQSVLDRMLGAGSITLESAGEHGQETFEQIAHPIAVQKKIYEAAEAHSGKHAGSISVADELAKLADLRDRGVLTAGEFEARKTKLLGT